MGSSAARSPSRSTAAPRGVLVLHGFGDTPQSVSELARALQARGYTVSAPLLAGHGRTLREFAASGGDEWFAGARAALDDLQLRCTEIFVVGQSLGGALATILAAETPIVRAIVLLVPYFDVPPAVRRIMPIEPVLQAALPYITTADDRSIHDPERTRALTGVRRNESEAHRGAHPDAPIAAAPRSRQFVRERSTCKRARTTGSRPRWPSARSRCSAHRRRGSSGSMGPVTSSRRTISARGSRQLAGEWLDAS